MHGAGGGADSCDRQVEQSVRNSEQSGERTGKSVALPYASWDVWKGEVQFNWSFDWGSDRAIREPIHLVFCEVLGASILFSREFAGDICGVCSVFRHI